VLLALDTATEHIRLALIDGARAWPRTVPGEKGRSHSLVLLPSLDRLMKDAGASKAGLSGVVCCVGPGGFTGLRTGVATAEGLALTGLPTWGFSSFALWAEAVTGSGQSGPFWILLDGQRSEAFAQRWEGGRPGKALREPLAALAPVLGAESWWAPEAFVPRLEEVLPSGRIALGNDRRAGEEALVALARRVCLGPAESPLVPFYLRETDAEANFPGASAHLPESHRRGLAR
jgi:tRNA threonylcarbamoyladenosine biosynthesis protein TsaB